MNSPEANWIFLSFEVKTNSIQLTQNRGLFIFLLQLSMFSTSYESPMYIAKNPQFSGVSKSEIIYLSK